MKKAEVQAKGLESKSSSDISHQLKITELSNAGHLDTHTDTHTLPHHKGKYRWINNTAILQEIKRLKGPSGQ